jgi:hypothetical protein
MRDISNTSDIIDVRGIIERIEDLRGDRSEYDTESDVVNMWAAENPDDAEELAVLESFMGELSGAGGDEKWEGAWYPVTLIRESYFTDYAQEFAEEIGAVPNNAQWPCTCIDWSQAARELKMHYSSAEYDGVTYYFR